MALPGAAPPTTTVLICRHGETEWNNARKFQGTFDIPLNENGREQAERLAGVLNKMGLAAVWTSPMLRAHATASRIANTCKVELRIDQRLCERTLGVMQGKSYKQVRREHPLLWTAWKAFEPLPPEALAEHEGEVIERMESALFDLGAKYPNSIVAAVGHGGTMRCLLKQSGAVGNGSITTLIVGPGRKWRLVGVDYEEHLSKPALKLGDLSDPELPRAMEGIPITTLMLCRHGESVGNQQRQFQGTLDPPLNADGVLQAGCMGRALKTLGLSALWTSSLARAYQSAMEISLATGVPVQTDPRLYERNLGKLQGMPHALVKEKYPEAWKAWKGYLPLPEEVGAEPKEAVSERLESAFFELAALYPGQVVGIVVHGANARCLLMRSIGNASITTIEIGPGRQWHVRKLGDASHLPPALRLDAIKASKL